MNTLNEHTVHSHGSSVPSRTGTSGALTKASRTTSRERENPQGTVCLGQYRGIPGGRGKWPCDKVHYTNCFQTSAYADVSEI